MSSHVLISKHRAKSFSNHTLGLSSSPKVFGYSTFVHIPQQHRSKLDLKATKCIFLGYFLDQKGYKCYPPVTKKFYNSMDVTFFENQPYYSTIDIQGENRIQEYQFWEIETMTEPQTLESVIVHNSNPIPPAPSLSFQTNEFIDTEPSTPLCLISSQIANNNEFIIYSRKKKKSQEDIEQ